MKLEHVDVDSNTNNSLLPEDDSEELFNLAYDDLDLDDQDYKPPVQTSKPKRGRKPKNNTQQQQQTKSITVKKEDPEILDESQGKDIAIIRKPIFVNFGNFLVKSHRKGQYFWSK